MGDDGSSAGLSGLRKRLPLVAAVVVTVMVAAALVLVDHIDQLRRVQESRALVATQLASIRAKLEFSLNAPLLRARGVVAQIVTHGDITPEEFESVAKVLMKDQKHVRNMIVSRGLVISMTYPLAGNESVIGVDFRSVPVQYESVKKAIEGRTSLLQGPVPLIQGGTGLILRTPVFLPTADGEERFFGMANVVLDIPSILADAGLVDDDLPLRVAIRGRDGLGAKGEMVFGSPSLFAADPVLADVKLILGSWQMAAVPRGGWNAIGSGFNRVRLLELLAFVAAAAMAFGTAFHVIGQQRAARALARANDSLARSNADLERFAYLASHDLQTPLRNVGLYAQLLQRRYGQRLDEDADTFIAFIVDGVHRMSTLVNDLLNYARLSGGSDALQAVPAGDAASAAIANLAGAIEETGARVELAGNLPTVRANRQQMVSLFQNLFDNAIKYRDDQRRPEIAVSAQVERAGWWRFAVADNGIGIAAEYFDRIFVPFQRLHPPGDRPGTGIGLAICQRIIDQAGGRLWVESRPGEGTTFLFTLPGA